MQRFPLCFFSHHQNFPLQTLLGQSALLLQSLLFLVTPLYGSSSAPVPPYRAPFLRCRDTRSFLYTPPSSSFLYTNNEQPFSIARYWLLLTSKLSSQLHDVPASQEFGIPWTLPNCSTTPRSNSTFRCIGTSTTNTVAVVVVATPPYSPGLLG